MNLQKLLAENMIRFGTRNLTEHQVRKILKEAMGAPGPMTNPNATVQTFVTTPTTWGPVFTKQVATVKSLLTKYGITFSAATPDLAAAFIALKYSAPTIGSMYAVGFGKSLSKGNISEFSKAVDASSDGVGLITNWAGETVIQFNESPDNPGKVLTVGVITKTGVSNQNPGESSEMADILSYLNDFNISAVANIDFVGTRKQGSYQEGIVVLPYVMRADSGYSTKGIKDGSFIEGIPGKTPGAGSLNLEVAYDDLADSTYLYASQKYTAASAQTTGTQTTDVVWTEGPETKAELPQNMFAKMKIKLDATLTPLLTTAIEGAKKIGQITGLRIESGASFDEPVDYDNATFAKEVGMAPNQVPADPRQDKEGVVTDPMSGGNAFLAIMRGKAIQTAIGNTAGVTPTMTATVATGGAAARFAALYFNIKKPDGTTTTTKDDLKSIGAKTNVEQLGGQFKVVKVYI